MVLRRLPTGSRPDTCGGSCQAVHRGQLVVSTFAILHLYDGTARPSCMHAHSPWLVHATYRPTSHGTGLSHDAKSIRVTFVFGLAGKWGLGNRV